MRRRGFSLIEILLVCTLLLILLTLCLDVLMPLIQTYIRSDRRTALVQGVASAMDKIVLEVQESNVRGINFPGNLAAPVSSALVLQPLSVPDPTGLVQWTSELHCFVCQNAILSYSHWSGPALLNNGTISPYALLPSELPAILSVTAATQLLSGVTTFQVSGLATRTLPITIQIGVTLPTGENLQLTHQAIPRSRASR